MIKQAHTYSPPVKAFKKQTKTIEDPWKKQMKALESWEFFNKLNELKQV